MYNNHGAASTVMPSSINTSAGVSETTSDGYKWKYLYTITAADALKHRWFREEPFAALPEEMEKIEEN